MQAFGCCHHKSSARTANTRHKDVAEHHVLEWPKQGTATVVVASHYNTWLLRKDVVGRVVEPGTGAIHLALQQEAATLGNVKPELQPFAPLAATQGKMERGSKIPSKQAT